MQIRRSHALVAAAAALPLILAGTAPPASADASPKPAHSPKTFGTGCSALPTSGKGSAAEAAKKKTGDAIAGSKDLSKFHDALKKAGLDKKLNDTKHVTVFAPTDAAFGKLSKTQLDSLMKNTGQLKKALEYHVVDKSLTRTDLAKGSFTTVEGSKLTTTGSGEQYKVNGTATITCGDIETANGHINLIDTVLMPPS
ncbi:fasciclin domain-containing protein [Streptomyces sp. NPDC057499]|uniref:fasciclin domain-containing protein n=1 Tax=Streptomyces sp. NPDC057499 TaxID=3346150 RepID=UPI0036B4DAC3